ncbi:MAG TPA: recombinase family protein [Candidatus Limnocylindria bacterium]|nr:recombinase family protein [Candidatus Limnocylindria bacterium]
MATPAAYLRKSKDAATKAEHLERLLSTVRAHGHNGDTRVYDDWARSGDQGKLSSRTDWRRLCEAIERGDHDVVFMNDLDRGGRSLEEWLRFIRVAREHGVRVIAGGLDYSAPENKDRLVFEAWLAERELDAAKRRAAETMRMRRRRGDAVGGAPYGKRFAKDERGVVVLVDDPNRPVGPVLDAIRESRGNVMEAVRLLNDRRVPSKYGKAWSDAALRHTLRRLGAMPPDTRKVRRTRTGAMREPSALAKLVRCHCGQIMTPVDSAGRLYCYIGQRQGLARHGRYGATQRRVLDLLRAETEGRREEKGRVIHSSGAGAAERRAALEEELRRLGVAYRAGAVDDKEFLSESGRLRGLVNEAKADEDAEDEAVSIRVRLTGPLVHWDRLAHDPVGVGAELRALFREVRMDEAMQAVEAVWR